jgi:pimeloyl-ACP methyl ester carboxylesterase
VQIDALPVVPAMARNKQPDAVLMLAGGPGQSAISLAARAAAAARLNNRRDLVFIDQRGTGQSAPQCPEDRDDEPVDNDGQMRRLEACRAALEQLPYGRDGGVRFFTTTIAMQDMDAVREALAVPQWDLIGGSYGTRRAGVPAPVPDPGARTVIDGVAPPDMVLPVSFSTARRPRWTRCCRLWQDPPRPARGLGQAARPVPRQVTVAQLTGKPETFTLDPRC